MAFAAFAIALHMLRAPSHADDPSGEPADVRCYQALGYAFAAIPAQRDSLTGLLSFYAGRLSVRGDGWRSEVFAPASPPLNKENFSPIAEMPRPSVGVDVAWHVADFPLIGTPLTKTVFPPFADGRKVRSRAGHP